MTMYWVAERSSTTSRTDEDRAMAYVCYGNKHPDRNAARQALFNGLRKELDQLLWDDRYGCNEYSAKRLVSIIAQLTGPQKSNNCAESEGLRFQLRSYRAT